MLFAVVRQLNLRPPALRPNSPDEPWTSNDSDFLDFLEGLTRWWPVACDLGPEWRSWVRIVSFFFGIRAQSSRRALLNA